MFLFFPAPTPNIFDNSKKAKNWQRLDKAWALSHTPYLYLYILCQKTMQCKESTIQMHEMCTQSEKLRTGTSGMCLFINLIKLQPSGILKIFIKEDL
jgi:hypothetical protein